MCNGKYAKMCPSESYKFWGILKPRKIGLLKKKNKFFLIKIQLNIDTKNSKM